MKKFLGSLAFTLLGGVILLSAPGCKTECGKDEQSGATGCVSKSATEFNGTPVVIDPFTYNLGDTLTIDTVYGDIKVEQGGVDQIEVTFKPFDYEGYDEKDLAVRQMNEDLDLSVLGNTIKAAHKNDPTNGLGADIFVKLPASFNGTLKLINRAGGPLNHFESDIDYAASAVGIDIQAGSSDLTECHVDGSPTVINSTIDCGSEVKLLNVSDNVNITLHSDTALDDAVVNVSLTNISDTAAGGAINVPNGSIDITFPASSDYSILANAPNGAVSSGTVPTGCVENAASEQSKGYTCGAGGPTYDLKTDGDNDVFTAGTIFLHMQ